MEKLAKNRIFLKILLLWGAWSLISFSLMNGFDHPSKMVNRLVPTLFGFIIIIAINVKYLLPTFYLQKRYVAYILSSMLLLAITVLLLYHPIFPWSDWFKLPPPPRINELGEFIERRPSGVRWMRELTPLIIAFLGSTLLEVSRIANIKEKEKLASELKFLKSQVNPHFLFNALNNIYSLSVVQAPQTPETIMQLSEILRYMVYDSNEEKVPLKSEINYIENFVELQLLKDSRGMDVTLDLDKTAPNLMVAPLLFIPFVENAFKHSQIENLRDGFINIQLKVADKTITFRVLNSRPKNNFTKDKVGGVGLENVKKRLELLYPNEQHQLTIHPTDDQFEVNLVLRKHH
ncbi:MAG: histidine kinase [Bacteroidota bacterium]